MTDVDLPAEDSNQILVSYRRHIMQLFRNLLIPEVFSKILRNLKPKDRLNLRLCCRDTEEAVARSDMHIEGLPQFIYLSTVGTQFKLLLGLKKDRTTLKLEQGFYDENGWDEIARVRERLFTRVYTRFVDIDVDFMRVPFELVARLLEGCFFEELDIKIENCSAENAANIVQYLCNLDYKTSRKIKAVFGRSPNRDALLSLKPLRVLKLKNDSIYILEELLIELCRQQHVNLVLNIVAIEEQPIMEIVKIVGDNPNPQSVKFNVFAAAAERFVLTTGFRLVKDRKQRDEYANIIKQRRREDEKADDEVAWRVRKIIVDEWTGSFEMTTGRVHVYAHYFVSQFKFTICNFSDPDEVQSDDDEDTVYF